MSRVIDRRGALAGVALGLLLAAAGCGSSSGSGDADPAELAPASAPIYAEATIDPTGEQETAVRSIIERFPGGAESGGTVEGLLERGFEASDTKLSFAGDVRPWLGGRVGGFVTGATENDGDGAVAIATTNDEAARDALEKELAGEAEERSYEGSDYLFRGDEDTAAGIVEGFLVIGTEAGFRAAVDAAGGESLVDSDRFTTAIDRLSSDRLAALYLDIARVLEIASLDEELSGPEGEVTKRILELAGDAPLAVTLSAESDAIVLDSATTGRPGIFASPALGFGEGTELLAELPGDSWFAIGAPELGETASAVLDSLGSVPGLDRESLAAALKAQTGLDLDRDVLGWIGDFAVFARGTDRQSISGGVVLETTDDAASRRALEALEQLVRKEDPGSVVRTSVGGADDGFALEDPSLPEPINVVQGGDRVVIGYGDEATEAALDPESTLEEEPDFQAATEGLGEGYVASGFVAVEPILALAESFGADSDPEYAQARPILEQFAHLIAGSRQDGETVLSRSRVQLK